MPLPGTAGVLAGFVNFHLPAGRRRSQVLEEQPPVNNFSRNQVDNSTAKVLNRLALRGFPGARFLPFLTPLV